jgi:lysosomal Pro-X carboxypeptidase
VTNTTERWFAQRIDHLTSNVPPGGNLSFEQRYFVYDKHWASGNPIFFYCGNEANVELYVNATGLMWERAENFGAMLIWAEHRYYGESQPFGSLTASSENRDYLSVEQAMHDYAALVGAFKRDIGSPDSAVIAFGGSYGGMLASWMRFKYPHLIDGAIAASAPIWSFEGENPQCNPNFYADGVTYDVSQAGGVSTPWCEANFRAAFAQERLVYAGSTTEGRAALADAFHLCEPLDDDPSAGWTVTYWVNEALSYMAMGNYPYASSYILNGDGELPPFPVITGCDAFLGEDLTATCGSNAWDVCPPLYEGLAKFAGVYYNNSGSLPCNNLTASVNPESAMVNNLWGYQYCTEIFQLFGQDGITDIFWPYPWNTTAEVENCGLTNDGLLPRVDWATITFGDHDQWRRSTSNIVWSNGEYDPWAGGGVNYNLSESLLAIKIPRAAHHLDLMFSDPGDTDAVKEARDFEMHHVRRWIAERKETTI